MTRLLAALVMPLLGGLAMTSDLVLEAVFGAKWLPAAPALRILCVLGVLRCLLLLTSLALRTLSKKLLKRLLAILPQQPNSKNSN